MYNQNNPNSTAMVERTPFQLPDVATECGFSQEELAEDMEGLQLGFQRVKIPSGGALQFEIPGDDPDNPEYVKYLEGVILYSHNSNAYWPEGSEYDDNAPPVCQSLNGNLGIGDPGGLCASCSLNRFGSDPKTGRGKACKNMRIVYLLRSGEIMPIQLTLAPTSIRPYSEFVNAAFLSRRRGVCGGVVRIGLKRKSNGKDDYSVATFQKLYDFTGEDLARVRTYAENFKQQVKLMLEQRSADIEAEAGSDVEMGAAPMDLPDNGDRFVINVVDGDRGGLPD